METRTSPLVIRLNPEDGVVIARGVLMPGTEVLPGVSVGARRIPAGHKVAVRPHAKGEPIRRYGQIIGFATDAIEPGAWVHTHNCEMGDFSRDYAWGVDAKPTASCRRAGDLHGHPPRRWARRDAQLHRHRHQRELLGPCGGTDRAAVRAQPDHRRRPARRLARMSTAWWR